MGVDELIFELELEMQGLVEKVLKMSILLAHDNIEEPKEIIF